VRDVPMRCQNRSELHRIHKQNLEAIPALTQSTPLAVSWTKTNTISPMPCVHRTHASRTRSSMQASQSASLRGILPRMLRVPANAGIWRVSLPALNKTAFQHRLIDGIH
jgi:hypothetical protein